MKTLNFKIWLEEKDYSYYKDFILGNLQKYKVPATLDMSITDFLDSNTLQPESIIESFNSLPEFGSFPDKIKNEFYNVIKNEQGVTFDDLIKSISTI
jgi:hypothetical protein